MTFFIILLRITNAQAHSYHPDWLAGAHVIIVGIPALELGVLSVFQDVLLSLKVGVIVANEGAALHADGVDPVQEAAFLEVVTVAADLELPPSEAFALIQHNLSHVHTKIHVIAPSLTVERVYFKVLSDQLWVFLVQTPKCWGIVWCGGVILPRSTHLS